MIYPTDFFTIKQDNFTNSKSNNYLKSYIIFLSLLSILISTILFIFNLKIVPNTANASNLTRNPKVLDFSDYKLTPVSNEDLKDLENLQKPGSTNINQVELIYPKKNKDGLYLTKIPKFTSKLGGKFVGKTPNNEYLFFTVDPELQNRIESIVRNSKSRHVAIVVSNPRNGKILALSGKSPTIKETLTHSGFPAASLIKVLTSAAAIEGNTIGPLSYIRFRGGNYSLSPNNFRPNLKKDTRLMTVEEALGKSVNPVFGRIALEYVGATRLRQFTNAFGFNSNLSFDIELPISRAVIPTSDYELSRTGAGFGDVSISPLHAASLIGAVANEGKMQRLRLIDKVVSSAGTTIYRSTEKVERVALKPSTSRTVLNMLESTVTQGTSRKDFMKRSLSLKQIKIAGKTGSLTGKNPKGFTNWFIGAAPISNPEVAISVVVVDDPWLKSRAATLARLSLESYYALR